MDGVIPVEVASFRLGERLVSGVQCGATEERSPTGGRFSFNHPSRFFPEGAALSGSPAENLGELDGRVLDGLALGSLSRGDPSRGRHLHSGP